jgi:hypothetical protein
MQQFMAQFNSAPTRTDPPSPTANIFDAADNFDNYFDFSLMEAEESDEAFRVPSLQTCAMGFQAADVELNGDATTAVRPVSLSQQQASPSKSTLPEPSAGDPTLPTPVRGPHALAVSAAASAAVPAVTVPHLNSNDLPTTMLPEKARWLASVAVPHVNNQQPTNGFGPLFQRQEEPNLGMDEVLSTQPRQPNLDVPEVDIHATGWVFNDDLLAGQDAWNGDSLASTANNSINAAFPSRLAAAPFVDLLDEPDSMDPPLLPGLAGLGDLDCPVNLAEPSTPVAIAALEARLGPSSSSLSSALGRALVCAKPRTQGHAPHQPATLTTEPTDTASTCLAPPSLVTPLSTLTLNDPDIKISEMHVSLGKIVASVVKAFGLDQSHDNLPPAGADVRAKRNLQNFLQQPWFLKTYDLTLHEELMVLVNNNPGRIQVMSMSKDKQWFLKLLFCAERQIVHYHYHETRGVLSVTASRTEELTPAELAITIFVADLVLQMRQLKDNPWPSEPEPFEQCFSALKMARFLIWLQTPGGQAKAIDHDRRAWFMEFNHYYGLYQSKKRQESGVSSALQQPQPAPNQQPKLQAPVVHIGHRAAKPASTQPPVPIAIYIGNAEPVVGDAKVWLFKDAQTQFLKREAFHLRNWGLGAAQQGMCHIAAEFWGDLDALDVVEELQQIREAGAELLAAGYPTEKRQDHSRLQFKTGTYQRSHSRAAAWFHDENWPKGRSKYAAEHFFATDVKLTDQNFLERKPTGSHLCDQKFCINWLHICVEYWSKNCNRSNCFKAARACRLNGQHVQPTCTKHNPPCLLQVSFVHQTEIFLPCSSRLYTECRTACMSHSSGSY